MVLAEIDQIERSFIANVERGEQALESAENDYQRLEVRDAARAAQVITQVMGRRKLVRRFSVLVQRAERAIAQAHPPMSNEESGTLSGQAKNGEYESGDYLNGGGGAEHQPPLTPTEIKEFRAAHNRLSDEEFEALANEDTDDPLTRARLKEIDKEKKKEEDRLARQGKQQEALEAAQESWEQNPNAGTWAYVDGVESPATETMLQALDDGKDVIGVTDAIELLRALPDNSVDLLLTDIPYAKVNKPSGGLRIIDKMDANEETFDLDEFAAEVLRVTKGNAVIFCGKEQFSSLYQHFDERGFTTRMVVWEKTNPSPMNAEVMFLSGVECAVHFRKDRATFNDHYQNTVFRFPGGSSQRHPTEKSLEMFKRFVEVLSNPYDLVCDPCMGSGTTAVAAHQLGRRYLCSDLSSESAKVALLRLQESN